MGRCTTGAGVFDSRHACLTWDARYAGTLAPIQILAARQARRRMRGFVSTTYIAAMLAETTTRFAAAPAGLSFTTGLPAR